MARVQLIIHDKDKNQYIRQARKEGLTLSAWLRIAASERLKQKSQFVQFESDADFEDFFNKWDKLELSGTEPNWEQQLSIINKTRKRGIVKS